MAVRCQLQLQHGVGGGGWFCVCVEQCVEPCVEQHVEQHVELPVKLPVLGGDRAWLTW